VTSITRGGTRTAIDRALLYLCMCTCRFATILVTTAAATRRLPEKKAWRAPIWNGWKKRFTCSRSWLAAGDPSPRCTGAGTVLGPHALRTHLQQPGTGRYCTEHSELCHYDAALRAGNATGHARHLSGRAALAGVFKPTRPETHHCHLTDCVRSVDALRHGSAREACQPLTRAQRATSLRPSVHSSQC
jgi:hypothetical protein